MQTKAFRTSILSSNGVQLTQGFGPSSPFSTPIPSCFRGLKAPPPGPLQYAPCPEPPSYCTACSNYCTAYQKPLRIARGLGLARRQFRGCIFDLCNLESNLRKSRSKVKIGQGWLRAPEVPPDLVSPHHTQTHITSHHFIQCEPHWTNNPLGAVCHTIFFLTENQSAIYFIGCVGLSLTRSATMSFTN